MPPEPAFIMGLLIGSLGLLTIQSFIKSRVKKALASTASKDGIVERDEEIAHLKDRIAVMERITVDRGIQVADEIEKLR